MSKLYVLTNGTYYIHKDCVTDENATKYHNIGRVTNDINDAILYRRKCDITNFMKYRPSLKDYVAQEVVILEKDVYNRLGKIIDKKSTYIEKLEQEIDNTYWYGKQKISQDEYD